MINNLIKLVTVSILLTGCADQHKCRFISDGSGIGMTCVVIHKLPINKRIK